MDSERNTESLKFLCSYGGKILPRQTDGKLRYLGGLTRVLSVDRSISFAELMVKLVEFCGSSVNLKCQLPGGDLETLISITSDEDLSNLIEEYDRASSCLSHPLKIKAVLSPPKSLKRISPPLSSLPSLDFASSKTPFKAVDSLPNSPPNRFGPGTSSPPIRYAVASCSKRTCYYPCHIQESPRFLYSAPHGSYWR